MVIDIEKITTVSNIHFIKNHKEYNKKSYILMTEKMKMHMQDKENIV